MNIAIYFIAFLLLMLSGVAIAIKNIESIDGRRTGPIVDLVNFNVTWATGIGIIAGIVFCLVNPFSTEQFSTLLPGAFGTFFVVTALCWLGRFIYFNRAGNCVALNLIVSHIFIALSYGSIAYGAVHEFSA